MTHHSLWRVYNKDNVCDTFYLWAVWICQHQRQKKAECVDLVSYCTPLVVFTGSRGLYVDHVRVNAPVPLWFCPSKRLWLHCSKLLCNGGGSWGTQRAAFPWYICKGRSYTNFFISNKWKSAHLLQLLCLLSWKHLFFIVSLVIVLYYWVDSNLVQKKSLG